MIPYGNGLFATSLVLFNEPDDYRIHVLTDYSEDIQLHKTWEKAILVTSCTNTKGSDFIYALETEISKTTGTGEQPLYAFNLHGAYPNPFNPSTTISFTLSGYGHVSVRAFNVRGQQVAVLFDGSLDAGEKRILWKPENLAAGVYLVNIASPAGSKTTKLLFLK